MSRSAARSRAEMGRRPPLLERLTPGASGPPLVLDGAQGTALLDARPSALPPLPVDLLNLEDPDRVIGLHRAHLAAGAQVLRTNPFNACERALGGRGVGAGSSAVAEAGARAARVAAREAGVDDIKKEFDDAVSYDPEAALCNIGALDELFGRPCIIDHTAGDRRLSKRDF